MGKGKGKGMGKDMGKDMERGRCGPLVEARNAPWSFT